MIGNFHLSPGESRIQMSVWSILPAPLLMSNDLRNMDKESKEILLNKVAISINQDHLGLPGKRIYEVNNSLLVFKSCFLIDVYDATDMNYLITKLLFCTAVILGGILICYVAK